MIGVGQEREAEAVLGVELLLRRRLVGADAEDGGVADVVGDVAQAARLGRATGRVLMIRLYAGSSRQAYNLPTVSSITAASSSSSVGAGDVPCLCSATWVPMSANDGLCTLGRIQVSKG